MVARGVNAIDNEFNETRRDDAARLDELLYVAGAPATPSPPSPGATPSRCATAALSAVAAVKALYQDHYHASNMKLCLVAPAASTRRSLVRGRARRCARAARHRTRTGRRAAGARRREAPPAPLRSPRSPRASALARVAPARGGARPAGWCGLGAAQVADPCDLAAHCLGHEGQSALAQPAPVHAASCDHPINCGGRRRGGLSLLIRAQERPRGGPRGGRVRRRRGPTRSRAGPCSPCPWTDGGGRGALGRGRRLRPRARAGLFKGAFWRHAEAGSRRAAEGRATEF